MWPSIIAASDSALTLLSVDGSMLAADTQLFLRLMRSVEHSPAAMLPLLSGASGFTYEDEERVSVRF